MTRCGWSAPIAAAVLAASVMPASAQTVEREECEGPAPPVGSRWHEDAETAVLDVVLPGRLISYALPRTGGGRRDVLLLVDPTDPEGGPAAAAGDEDDDRMPPCESAFPLRLYGVDPRKPDDLRLVRDDLPRDASRLDSVDLDDDGSDEVFLHRSGKMLQLDVRPGGDEVAVPGDRVVLTHRDLGARRLHPMVVTTPDLADVPMLFTSGSGVFRVHRPSKPGGTWSTVGAVPVPFKANLREHGIWMVDRNVLFVGRRPAGTLIFATPPDAVDSQRLEVLVIEVSPDGVGRTSECWTRFPAPEILLEFHFLLRDDDPMLLTLSVPRGEVNFFGEKQLRLHGLESSRSRLGTDPRFGVQTRMNVWQTPRWQLNDVDGDGNRDLLIGYWKGLTDDRVVLDAYLHAGPAWYVKSPGTTAFDVKDGDRSFLAFGHDLTGDALPDLVVRSGCDLVMYRGLSSRDGAKLVRRKEPTRLLERVEPDETGVVMTMGSEGARVRPYGAGRGAPGFVDLDGDGRPEVLVVAEGRDDRPGRFRAVWIQSEERPGAPDAGSERREP